MLNYHEVNIKKKKTVKLNLMFPWYYLFQANEFEIVDEALAFATYLICNPKVGSCENAVSKLSN